MSAEKYQFDKVSTAVIEDLFVKLHNRAKKEYGKAWERRRLAGALASKTLYLYVQPNAEELITEYLNGDEDGNKSKDDLDAEMTYDQRTECREIEVSFSAERCENEETAEISTKYRVELRSASALDDIVDVPEQVRSKVAVKLAQAEEDHMHKIREGELDEDEDDFNGTIAFTKEHKFALYEQQEKLDYNVVHMYDVGDYSVPMLKYQPDDDSSNSASKQTQPATINDISHDNIDSQQRDDTLALFEEIMRYQDIEKPVEKTPTELRVGQIMAILAILEFGEAQNEEQEAIIKDLI
ncbi:MAG: hypothetical protein JWM07_141 [Candidatus Saccharibacteria bacterium]|nr:hypothetical protein [Candidatus Saccharibacteria bacterium]